MIHARTEELQAQLEVTFSDPGLLLQALTHSSFSNEHPDEPDNERLEFLGDAILGAVVSDLLWKRYPECREGVLTRYKAVLVRERGLVTVAEHLNLGRYLRLGKGEELTGGREKASVLSDAVEALVAAVYLDQGFASAEALVGRWYAERIENVGLRERRVDYKTKLQEWSQAVHKQTPVYRIESVDGPDHARRYTAVVQLGERDVGTGEGGSKKGAEQAAAQDAYHLEAAHDSDAAV